MYVAVLAEVIATNVCDTSFRAEDVWIDVRVFHAEGGKTGLAGHSVTRFQGQTSDGKQLTEIPARGSAAVLVLINGIDQFKLYRYETVLSEKDDEGHPAYE